MDSCESIECCVCKEEFNDEEHRPHSLLCSHSICSSCVDQLIHLGNQSCPICRTKFQARSSKDLPVNRDLLELMNYTKQIEDRLRESIVSSSCGRCKESVEENITKQQKTKEELENSIQYSESLIEEAQNINRVIKNEIMVKLNDEIMMELIRIVNGNEKNIDELTEHKAKLQNRLKNVEEREKAISEAHNKIEKTKNFSTVGPIVDGTCGVVGQMNLIRNGKLELLKNHGVAQQKVKHIQRVLNLVNVQEIDNQTSIPLAGALWRNVEDLDYLSIDQFRRTNGEIYLVKRAYGERRYIKVTKRGNHNRLECSLMKEVKKVPSNARFFKVEYFEKLKHTGRTGSYMDLSIDETPLGRICIQYTDVGSHIASNHMAICSGEMGPSYANTNIIKVNRIGGKDEQVFFGDYERNDGSRGKAVIRSEPWWKSEPFSYENHTYALSYCVSDSEATASQFFINTGGKATHSCFGFVSEGSENLLNAIQTIENPRKIKIAGCGIIVNLKTQEKSR